MLLRTLCYKYENNSKYETLIVNHISEKMVNLLKMRCSYEKSTILPWMYIKDNCEEL